MSKHIVICGAGAALAQPLIQHLLDRGNEVTALCHRSATPFLPSDTLREIGGVDLVDQVKTREKVRTVGKIDGLVTLAGAVSNGRLDELPQEEWTKVLDANLTTAFNALSILTPRVNVGGNIVVVGSVVGSTGGFGCCNYAAAKAGLVGLVRGAANELTRKNIKINLLELGYIDEGMGKRLPETVKTRTLSTIPLGRFGKSEDFVRAVEFLLTTDYMTGGILTLAGGLR